MAPLVSHIKELGLIEATAYAQLDCFEAGGVQFARAEGIIPAPEANHAVKGAIVEALALQGRGEERSDSLQPQDTVTSICRPIPTTLLETPRHALFGRRTGDGLGWFAFC